MRRIRIVIMGAAGRDFHNFNVLHRRDSGVEVVAFTAAQIPNIAGRRYPPELAGPLYPEGIPIVSEDRLDDLLRDREIDEVVFSYSDVSHADVMHKACRAVARGARFVLPGASATMLPSRRPVVSICAVRTGAGKSPVTRRIASILRNLGRRVAIVRHPMPYGDLSLQAAQRFAVPEDLRRERCTIEEIEEYEPHLEEGNVVFAGVDYERVLRRAEEECDVVLWDGGNNDTPFIKPDLEIVVADPHRAGDELAYFPGEVNLRRANVVVIAKQDTADPASIERVRRNARETNPQATIVNGAMPIRLENPELVRGKRVLAIEDGPTVTHGGMAFGAAALAARRAGAAALVDPRPSAVGSLRETFENYPHLESVLPAMGYGPGQIRDLEETLRNVKRDVTVVGTPIDLARIVRIEGPVTRARYDFREIGSPTLVEILKPLLSEAACP